MTDQWYYRSQSTEFGPYSAAQLRQFAQAGRITAKTLVRDGKQADWLPASQIRGLLGRAERPAAPKSVPSPPPVPPRPGLTTANTSGHIEARRLPPGPVRRTKTGMLIASPVGSAVLLFIVLVYFLVGRGK